MRNKKNVIMAVMIAVALLMATGYAYFSTRLNINATGNIASTWNVYFESISSGTKVGGASNASTPNVSGTSANMNVNLNLPGDSMTYSLVLKNGGTIGAIIEDIDAVSEGSTGIIYSISGLNIGDKLAAGASKTITIKIEYDPNTTSQPSETYKKLTVTIDAVQDIGQTITTQTPIIEGELGTFARRIVNSNTVQSPSTINFNNGPGTVSSYRIVKNSEPDWIYFNNSACYFGTGYEFDESKGTYTLTGTTISSIFDNLNSISNYRYTCLKSSATATCTQLYEMTEKIDLYTAKGYTYMAKQDYAQDNGKGLYSAIDDDGTTYYFRGEVENNYVQFGTYEKDTTIHVHKYDSDASGTYSRPITIKAGTPMYWRIVRVNGDGTVRLVYDGTTLAENGAEHNSVIDTTYYTINHGTKYLGYTYDVSGKQTDSNIKTVLDSWYETHLKGKYDSHIADSIFCNDKSVEETGEDNFYRYTYNRISQGNPKLTCLKNDRYTMNTTIGNGLLKNPVGLLTADEVILAGGSSRVNNDKYYLYSSDSFWTMTPSWYMDSEFPAVWAIGEYNTIFISNMLWDRMNSEDVGVRPVINLKSDVSFTGNGTIDNPYVISNN